MDFTQRCALARSLAFTGRAHVLPHGALSARVNNETHTGWHFVEDVGRISSSIFELIHDLENERLAGAQIDPQQHS
jgi:hypothetical protein